MWTMAIKWLFGTAMGRGVMLGGSIAIGIAIGWYAFSTHYYNEGIAKCEADRMSAANESNVAQGERNIANNETASEIGREADTEAARIVEEAEKAKHESEESIHDVYQKPPVTAPVAVGSCVHPLDERVQDRIRNARAAATKARGA